MKSPVRILVIAGHDPTGGAGVDADREAAAAQGVEALCVLTARTDQDGVRVRSLGAREAATWLAEARSACALGAPRVLKTGLLVGAEHVAAAAELVRELELPVVVDPVLAASRGEEFLDDGGIECLFAELLPRGPILTPNLPEGARLTGLELEALATDLEARVEAAHRLLEGGARAVLLKGGHGREDPVADLLLEPGREPVWLEHPRVPGASLHGSGCRYASSVAAALARGADLAEAGRVAGEYLRRALEGAHGA